MNKDRSKKLLVDCYKFISLHGYCQSQEDFSSRFLGKSPRYYSMIKASKKGVSVEALAFLAVRLEKTYEMLRLSQIDYVRTRGWCARELSTNVWAEVRYACS